MENISSNETQALPKYKIWIFGLFVHQIIYLHKLSQKKKKKK